MLLFHIIVTFNKIDELKRLLDAIGNQDEQVHHLIWIDNTEKEYGKIKAICDEYSANNKFRINYYKTQRNVGSAAAFALGMQIAMEKGADWIWMHDDDGYPKPDCLANIRKYFSRKDTLLASLVVDQNNQSVATFSGVYDRFGNKIPLALSEEITPSDIAGTAGLFISKDVINSIGTYDYKHFFLGFEDFDYCMRAKKNRKKLYVVKNCQYVHPNKWGADKTYYPRKLFRYLGDISPLDLSVTARSYKYYTILHLADNFIINMLYSTAKVLLKKMFFRKVFLVRTLKLYAACSYNRFFQSKVVIQPDQFLSDKI
jgi:GT2 family glycosyltransferase